MKYFLYDAADQIPVAGPPAVLITGIILWAVSLAEPPLLRLRYA